MAKPHLPRRRLLSAGLGGLALAATPLPAFALFPTPRQTAGPFYPETLPLDHDNDLTRVEGQAATAKGEPTQVFGRVLGEDGRPLAGARVEIWQCDALGTYHHPRDSGRLDPAFQGYGQTLADESGGYRFRTIRPVAYGSRTPHIHFAVSGPGHGTLVTQMYVAGEPRNEGDFILRRISDPQARASVIVELRRDAALEPEGWVGRFELVLGRSLLDG